MIFASRVTCRALCLFLGLQALCLVVKTSVVAADNAAETRAINQTVLELYNRKQFDDAKVLALKGLALCDDAGDVKVFCAGQFHELLGDVAKSQNEFANALAHYEQALNIRESYPAIDDRLIARAKLRIGLALVGLKRNDEAEPALKAAIAVFEKQVPPDRQLGAALFDLEKIYISAVRPGPSLPRAAPSTSLSQPKGPMGLQCRSPGDFSVQHCCMLGDSSFTRGTTPKQKSRSAKACSSPTRPCPVGNSYSQRRWSSWKAFRLRGAA